MLHVCGIEYIGKCASKRGSLISGSQKTKHIVVKDRQVFNWHPSQDNQRTDYKLTC